MPDVSIVNTTVTASPKNYTVPGTQDLIVKAVRAQIDGSGAATPFLPALQLLDPAGNVMWTAVDPSTTVAAGGSADVSWFPGVKGSAAAGTSSGLPWLFVTRSPGPALVSGAAFAELDLNPALASVSTGSDGSGDIVLADVGDGTFGPSFTANGIYLVSWQVMIEVNAAPGAGTGANSRFTGATYYPVSPNDAVPFTQNPAGAGTYFADAGFAAVVNIDPGSQPAPQTLSVQAVQNSTHTTSATTISLYVQRTNPTGSTNF